MVYNLLEHFNVVESYHPEEFSYEFLQTLPSDELREKEFTEEAFTWPSVTVNAPPRVDAEFVGRAMSLIKVRLHICSNCQTICHS
jgi:hypothetical protein